LQGWNGVIATLRHRKADETYHCNQCESRPVCLGCPSLFLLETGSEQVISPYICETAKARLHKIIGVERDGCAVCSRPTLEAVSTVSG
jgi:sulfatase maturation enzyme AslB (radical SAM superfamily)